MTVSIPDNDFQVELPDAEPLSAEAYFACQSPVAGLPEVPRLACGAARLTKGSQGDATEVLHRAWSAGFLLTDTAPAYGESEAMVGEALRHWKGDCPILSTKCGRERPDEASDYSSKAITQRLERSRTRFVGRPISLLAIHDAEMCPPVQLGPCAQVVCALRDAGDVRGVGAGGGGYEVQRQLLEYGRLDYVMTYNRLSCVTLQAIRDIVPLCRARGVKLWAAGPLVGGLLGDDQGHFEALAQSGYLTDLPIVFVERARMVRELAADCAIPVSQMALRFLLSTPTVDIVVAGAATPQHWEDCMAAYHAGPLSPDMYRRLWHLAQQGRETTAGG